MSTNENNSFISVAQSMREPSAQEISTALTQIAQWKARRTTMASLSDLSLALISSKIERELKNRNSGLASRATNPQRRWLPDVIND